MGFWGWTKGLFPTYAFAICLATVSCGQSDGADQSLSAEQIYNRATVLYAKENAREDNILACNLFEKAADMGYDEAKWNAGYCYLTGRGRQKDVSRALPYIRDAAANGVTSAQQAYAQIVLLESPEPERYTQAIRYLNDILSKFDRRTADAYPFAAFTRGVAHYLGRGVAQNEEKAIDDFELAAMRGNALSAALLSYIFSGEAGYGIEADRSAADEWYELFQSLVAVGDIRSRSPDLRFANALAFLYDRGWGVPLSHEKADVLRAQ